MLMASSTVTNCGVPSARTSLLRTRQLLRNQEVVIVAHSKNI
jgi:hypothetical protein